MSDEYQDQNKGLFASVWSGMKTGALVGGAAGLFMMGLGSKEGTLGIGAKEGMGMLAIPMAAMVGALVGGISGFVHYWSADASHEVERETESTSRGRGHEIDDAHGRSSNFRDRVSGDRARGYAGRA